MKKREFKTIEEETLVNVSDEEVVREFINDFYIPLDWIDKYVDVEDFNFFFENYTELTREDKVRIINKIREACKLHDIKCKESEAELLENRRDILDFLERCIDRPYADFGEIGYALSPEEILDLILKNGNK